MSEQQQRDCVYTELVYSEKHANCRARALPAPAPRRAEEQEEEEVEDNVWLPIAL